MEMEQVRKVIRLDGNPMEIEDEVDGDDASDNEFSYMEKLPPEVLLKILSFLDEQQLVKIRIVNSRWNEISCLVLQGKTKQSIPSKLVVYLKKNMKCKTVITRSLDDFLACFSPSTSEAEKLCGRARPFPFSHFSVQNLKYMEMTKMCEFVFTFGPHMKVVVVTNKHEDIPNFEKFWRLLLHFAPNIYRFGIIGYPIVANVPLIDPITKFVAQTDPNVKAPSPNDTFLKNLKVLRIFSSSGFNQPNGFMKDLLDNTPNLEQVQPFRFSNWREYELQNVKALQRLGKAHLLKKLEIKSKSQSRLLPVDLLRNLQLKKLRANCFLSSNSVKNEKATTKYICHAINYSQETLTNLDLYQLTIESMNHCFKDISSLPKVGHLKIKIKVPTETGSILDQFSQVCPNTTNLNLDQLYESFSKVAPILWTGFKGVKSLTLELNMSDEKDLMAVDSAFSGYSKESIERIQSKLQQGISLEEAKRGEELKNPSILDLKSLSRLELTFSMGTRRPETETVENQLQNSVFAKILPHYIRECPRSISYRYLESN